MIKDQKKFLNPIPIKAPVRESEMPMQKSIAALPKPSPRPILPPQAPPKPVTPAIPRSLQKIAQKPAYEGPSATHVENNDALHPSILVKPSPPAKQSMQIVGTAKLADLIRDPSIISIECPGPEKPLLITRGGYVRAINQTMNGEEINNFMQEISSKTRIPIIPGLFKAAVENIIVTAVVSDVIGTRFVIEKKSSPIARMQ